MNNFDWKGFISLVLGLSTFTAGCIAYWRGSVEKAFAAQRDFQHLKRNQEQIVMALQDIAKEQDEKLNDLTLEMVRLNALLTASMAKSGDSVSGIRNDR